MMCICRDPRCTGGGAVRGQARGPAGGEPVRHRHAAGPALHGPRIREGHKALAAESRCVAPRLHHAHLAKANRGSSSLARSLLTTSGKYSEIIYACIYGMLRGTNSTLHCLARSGPITLCDHGIPYLYTSKDVLVIRNSVFLDELDSLLLKPNQKIPKCLFYLPLLQIGFFAVLVQMIAACLLG
jgi:hypothetical protein